MPLYLVNSVKNIENKKYLELGIHVGHHINGCAAKNKIGVDIAFNPTFKMTTDQFFANIATPQQLKFDIVYIDADHNWKSARKDFNNCIQHLNYPSIIFMHDMYPEKEEDIGPIRCGSAYILLDAMLSMNYPNLYVQNFDCGVTMILNPRILVTEESCNPFLTYKEFRRVTKNLKLYTVPEMLNLLPQD